MMSNYSYLEATLLYKKQRRTFALYFTLMALAALCIILLPLFARQILGDAPWMFPLAVVIAFGLRYIANRKRKESNNSKKEALSISSNFLIEEVGKLYSEKVYFMTDKHFKYFPRKSNHSQELKVFSPNGEINEIVKVSLNRNNGDFEVSRP